MRVQACSIFLAAILALTSYAQDIQVFQRNPDFFAADGADILAQANAYTDAQVGSWSNVVEVNPGEDLSTVITNEFTWYRLGPGTFNVSSYVPLPSNIRITGSGQDVTYITTDNFRCLYISGTRTNIIVEDLTDTTRDFMTILSGSSGSSYAVRNVRTTGQYALVSASTCTRELWNVQIEGASSSLIPDGRYNGVSGGSFDPPTQVPSFTNDMTWQSILVKTPVDDNNPTTKGYVDGLSKVAYFTMPFVSTNATYEIAWFGPFDETRTLQWVQGQTESGTQLVYIVEKVTNATWRGVHTTNNTIILDSDSERDTTWADATLDVGNMLGYKFGSYSSTQGTVNVKCTY